MLRLPALTAALLIVGSSAFADSITMKGWGAQPCSKWISEHQANSSSIVSVAQQGWVLGFVSGVAWGQQNDFLKYTDYNAILKAVDQQCTLKPAEAIFDAAISVARELYK